MERAADDVSVREHAPLAVGSVAILVIGLSFGLHEGAHALVGWLLGGHPTLVTATEVRGDFSSLSRTGFILFGASGMIVNTVLAVGALLILRWRRPDGNWGLFWWLLFAFGGTLVATKTLMEPAAQWGDWMTILRRLPEGNIPRRLALISGLLGIVVMVRTSASALSPLLLSTELSARRREARRIVLLGALAAGVFATGSGVGSEVGAMRGILLGLGGAVGPLVVLLLATRRVSSTPGQSSLPSRAEPTRGWLMAAGVMIVVTWLVMGPGISI